MNGLKGWELVLDSLKSRLHSELEGLKGAGSGREVGLARWRFEIPDLFLYFCMGSNFIIKVDLDQKQGIIAIVLLVVLFTTK